MWSGRIGNRGELKKHRLQVPRETVMSVLSANIPVEMKSWLIHEAERREIPISWIVTELIGMGKLTYEALDMDKSVEEPEPEIESGKRQKRCACGRVAVRRDVYAGWICEEC